MTFFIHATNVHSGGGHFLLRTLLQALPADCHAIALLDTRMQLAQELSPNLTIKRVAPSLWQRLKAEKWLAKTVKQHDFVLCFGNLPPLFALRAKTLVFVQNRYLIDPVKLNKFTLKTRLRLMVERFWLAKKTHHATGFVVQTPSMRDLLEASGFIAGKAANVLPFVNDTAGYERSPTIVSSRKAAYDFIYVASGEPHKNHRHLIEAWALLARSGVRPSLLLTLDKEMHPELCLWINVQKTRFELHVDNLGAQPHDEVLNLYTQVRALIYPSVFESFGLPLIEARQAGLAILAAELDFVRDVVDPDQVFDPHSPVSIARAVQRFLGNEEAALPLVNAEEFLARIFQVGELSCAS